MLPGPRSESHREQRSRSPTCPVQSARGSSVSGSRNSPTSSDALRSVVRAFVPETHADAQLWDQHRGLRGAQQTVWGPRPSGEVRTCDVPGAGRTDAGPPSPGRIQPGLPVGPAAGVLQARGKASAGAIVLVTLHALGPFGSLGPPAEPGTGHLLGSRPAPPSPAGPRALPLALNSKPPRGLGLDT